MAPHKLLALCIASMASAQTNPLMLTVSPAGAYSVGVAGWNTVFMGGAYGLMVGGKWLSTSTGDLTVSDMSTHAGVDGWGNYNATVLTWKLANGTAVMATAFRVYSYVNAIAFETTMLTTISTGSAGASAHDGVSTSFPAWSTAAPATPLGWMQWHGAFIDDGANGPSFGTYGPTMKIAPGLGGGPVVLFDETAEHTVLLSPMSSFMSTSCNQVGAELRYGVFGSALVLPAGHTTSSMLWYGTTGINPTVMSWGAGLLRYYNKPQNGPQMDYSNTHLIYNTDHGAYYYYKPEAGKDYLATLLDYNNYAVKENIPYKGVLLDSWWYYKGVGTGTMNWTAMPSVFAGGNAGIRQLTQTTGWKVVAHNRYWSADTNYAKQNGGNWSFFIDTKAEGNMAVPLEQAFWEWLLTSAVKDWGLTTYEQDWLYNELGGVEILQTDVNAARTWLTQMNGGAAAAGVTVQYCMPYPRHVLQTVELSQTTQVRASDDHVPGLSYLPMQWRLGYSSILAWALALAPFKDNTWTTQHQPGGSCGNSNETSVALHNAISVLSAGPYTPGDGIGYSSQPMIMRGVTSGGRILQPSRAATSIDGQIIGRVFRTAAKAVIGEVYATYSVVSGMVWDTILAAVVNTTATLGPSALLSTRADLPAKRPEISLVSPVDAVGPSVAYSVNALTFDQNSLVVQPFDDAHPISLGVSAEPDFVVWHTAPILGGGVSVLGELTKWVPLSEGRVKTVTSDGVTVSVLLYGEAGESVPFSFYTSTGVLTVPCVLGSDGTATVSSTGTCTA